MQSRWENCIISGFKELETIDEDEKSLLLNTYWKLHIKQNYHAVWGVEKNIESKNLIVAKANKGTIMLLSYCVW